MERILYFIFENSIYAAIAMLIVLLMDSKGEYCRMLYDLCPKNKPAVETALNGSDVKSRIKHTLTYKRPTKIVAILAALAVAFTFTACVGTVKTQIDAESPSSSEVDNITMDDFIPEQEQNGAGVKDKSDQFDSFTEITYQVTRDDLFYIGGNDISQWAYIDSKGLTVLYTTRDGRTKDKNTIKMLFDLLDYRKYEYIGNTSNTSIEPIEKGTDYPTGLNVVFFNAEKEYTKVYLDGKGKMLYINGERNGQDYDDESTIYKEYKEMGLPAHEPDPVPGILQYYSVPPELYDKIAKILFTLPETRRNIPAKIVNGVNGYIAEDGCTLYQYDIESELISEIICFSDLRVVSEAYNCDFVITRTSDKFQDIIWPAFWYLDCIEPIEPQPLAEDNDTHTVYLFADNYYGTDQQDNHSITILGDSGLVKVNLNNQIEWYDGGERMRSYCNKIAV